MPSQHQGYIWALVGWGWVGEFAFLFKGSIKTADNDTVEVLQELNVTALTPQKTPSPNMMTSVIQQTYIASIKSKRDKKTLHHKRQLEDELSLLQI